MIRDVDLVSYLPPFVQEYQEPVAALESENPEFTLIWNAVNKVLYNRFISTADEDGVARWEKILEIYPNATDSLEERKVRIFTRMNEHLPYTYVTLQQRLGNICGDDGYYTLLDTDNYNLDVKIALKNENILAEIDAMLQRMLPENITYKIVLFNIYKIVSQFTHGQLQQYTYAQLRKEVLK